MPQTPAKVFLWPFPDLEKEKRLVALDKWSLSLFPFPPTHGPPRLKRLFCLSRACGSRYVEQ